MSLFLFSFFLKLKLGKSFDLSSFFFDVNEFNGIFYIYMMWMLDRSFILNGTKIASDLHPKSRT